MNRAERLARNEDMFRTVNERILALNERLGVDPASIEFVCECANAECAEQVALTRDEYERVRQDPRQFLLVTGHELPEIERVVARTEHYTVVAKVDEDAARVVEELDPRS